MTILQFIVAFGISAGLLSVLVVFVFQRLRKSVGGDDPSRFVPKTFMGGLGVGGLPGIGSLIASRGQNEPARMTLNTVVMTPTRGLRLISLGGSALILFAIWTPAMREYGGGNLALHLALTALLAYAALFISGYEARYDENGITAPNWLFMDKHYAWEDFLFIRDDGHHLYKLRFEKGRLDLQKHLVGMPTFLTFVSELGEINKGR